MADELRLCQVAVHRATSEATELGVALRCIDAQPYFTMIICSMFSCECMHALHATTSLRSVCLAHRAIVIMPFRQPGKAETFHICPWSLCDCVHNLYTVANV